MRSSISAMFNRVSGMVNLLGTRPHMGCCQSIWCGVGRPQGSIRGLTHRPHVAHRRSWRRNNVLVAAATAAENGDMRYCDLRPAKSLHLSDHGSERLGRSATKAPLALEN